MTFDRALLFLWALGLLVPAGAQPLPSPAPVVTAYFSERPPFAQVEGQTGTLITLTKAILSEAGVRARFIELPGSRIADLLKAGQIYDLGVGWYRTPGKEPWARFSRPFYQELPVVAVMNTRAANAVGPAPRLDSLLTSGLSLGIKAGTSLGTTLDQKIRTLGIVPLETVVEVPAMLKLIQAGRMDYTLLCEEEASYLFKQDASLVPGLVMVHLIDPPPGNLRYFAYPEAFDPALAARIDAAIDKLRNSARLPATPRTFRAVPEPLSVDTPALPDQSSPDRVKSPAKTPTLPVPTKDGRPPQLPDPPSGRGLPEP